MTWNDLAKNEQKLPTATKQDKLFIQRSRLGRNSNSLRRHPADVHTSTTVYNSNTS